VAGEEEAAALCINFIVKSREDIDFGVGPWLLADDILTSVKLKTTIRDRMVGPALLLLVSLSVQEHLVLGCLLSVVV
jgi:hypothetical protein